MWHCFTATAACGFCAADVIGNDVLRLKRNFHRFGTDNLSCFNVNVIDVVGDGQVASQISTRSGLQAHVIRIDGEYILRSVGMIHVDGIENGLGKAAPRAAHFRGEVERVVHLLAEVDGSPNGVIVHHISLPDRGPGLTQKEGGLGGHQGGVQRPLPYGTPGLLFSFLPKVPLCSPCPPHEYNCHTVFFNELARLVSCGCCVSACILNYELDGLSADVAE